MSASAAERRQALLGAKLRGLLAEHGVDVGAADVADFAGGAAVVAADTAWVLADRKADRALGPALAWSRRRGATTTSLLVDDEVAAGSLARRGQALTSPVDVYVARGRRLERADPVPLAAEAAPSADHLAFVDTIERAGAEPVVEHGVVTGEVRGLEVCRVVDVPTTGTFAEFADVDRSVARTADVPSGAAVGSGAGPGIEVGVGPNDREAFRIIHGHVPTVEALAGVVAAVEAVRGADVPHHPLNRLARERFVRWRVQHEPSLIGLDALAPASPPTPRPGLNDAAPCVASGLDRSARPVAVVFSTGADLDLVGFVADVQAASGLPVVSVLPGRDVLPITTELLGLLATPIEIVPVELT
jgi:hypothetical protein